MPRPILLLLSASCLALPLLAQQSDDDLLVRGTALLLDWQEGQELAEEWPYEGVYRERGPEGRVIPPGYRVGGTSIVGLALLDAPGWDDDSLRGPALQRALAFVLGQLELPALGAGFNGSYDVRGWGQIYALLFLLRTRALERCGPQLEAVEGAIPELVARLQATEIVESGGWNYSRRRGGDQAAPAATFMTAPALQALFAAQQQGFEVEARVVERALASLRAARLETGAFQYGSAPERQTGEGFEAVPGAIARMPVCEATLLLAGEGDVDALRAALAGFFEHWEELEKRRALSGTHEGAYMIAPYYFFFAHWYAAQAIELLPAEEREPLREQLRARILEVRGEDEGWNDRVFERSRSFGTACVMLALLQPRLDPPAGWQAEGD